MVICVRKDFFDTLSKYEGFERLPWKQRDEKFRSLKNIDDINIFIDAEVQAELLKMQQRETEISQAIPTNTV